MKYRQLGRTQWKVSEIGYGMWGMAGWKESDDKESEQALDGSRKWRYFFRYGLGLWRRT